MKLKWEPSDEETQISAAVLVLEGNVLAYFAIVGRNSLVAKLSILLGFEGLITYNYRNSLSRLYNNSAYQTVRSAYMKTCYNMNRRSISDSEVATHIHIGYAD